MTDEPTDQQASTQLLADILCDGYLLSDLATRLTCWEADAFAYFIGSHGASEESVNSFLRDHAAGDDDGDLHSPDGTSRGASQLPDLELREDSP